MEVLFGIGFFVLIGIPIIAAIVDFFGYIVNSKRWLKPVTIMIVEFIVVIVLPLMFLAIFDSEQKNDCCSDFSAFFSPEHRITIYTLLFFSVLSFFYSSYRKMIASPIIEVVVNCFLLIGIFLNILIGIQTGGAGFLVNIPIIMLFAIHLMENQKFVMEWIQEEGFEEAMMESDNPFVRYAWKILRLEGFVKYPVLILLCLPVMVILTAILILFGQQPDSSIRAFTDTYKHGLSELDYLCDNVTCGGHYLCSVAANGHKDVVKPVRLGVRRGNYIICNRQLLISNAFEDLIQENYPKLHKGIRRNYDKVGDIVHQHYHFFENKYVSDVVYILMKPFEWMFLAVLYIADKKPENRISKQYLRVTERRVIDNRNVKA